MPKPVAKKKIVALNRHRFGCFIRACRLGFGKSLKHNAFIRLSLNEAKTLLTITIAPTDILIPTDGRKYFIRWQDEPEKLDLIPALRSIKNPKRIFSFDVDVQTGELVKTQAGTAVAARF